MKNRIILIAHLLLAITCIYMSSEVIKSQLAKSLSTGYLTAIIIVYLSPILRTKAQAEKLKHYDKASKIVLNCLACIVASINIYYLF